MNINRTLYARMIKQLKPNKALLLFGARRVGKTFLIAQIAEKYGKDVLLLNGEDSDTLVLLADKSIANYRRILNRVKLLIIDEAQNIPDI